MELFYRQTCPYCIKVLNFIKKENIDIVLVDVDSNRAKFEKFVERTKDKRSTVPVLVFRSFYMYESDDIIHYLSTKR